MENKIYPNLQDICRLCLKENAGTVFIFPKEKTSDKYAALSIPMRIMACAALEVHDSDDFPKKICAECRLQLEKSYYFRKQSQSSDAKLRKHLRLISMGKVSKVFIKKPDEDDDEDEIKFKDTLDFIKEQEDKHQKIEKLKLENMINEMKLQHEQELENLRQSLKVTFEEQLKPQIREEVKKELKVEIQNELEEKMRQEIRENCMSEVKESLRSEVREECRQLEVKSLLEELQSYLSNKKKTLDTLQIKNKAKTKSPSPSKKEPILKRKCFGLGASKLEQVELEDFQIPNVTKDNIILSESIAEDELTTNDEECDSEGNFLIFDTDDCFDVQKKSENKDEYNNNNVTEVEYEDDEFIDSNSAAYEKINEENVDINEESEQTSTTSYRIEDTENGEIQFLKKSNDNLNDIDEENLEQTSDENIMIINFPEGIENDYVEEFEEVKYVKSKKHSKSNKSPEKHVESSLPSTVTRTTATLEATILTKTYVNPLQRCTDTPKTFKCDDCPMVFSTKPSLERHLRTHRKVAKTGVTFQCPECRIVVSCSSALRRHMYVHCEEKPFTCNECGKSFVQKEILKRHMQTHTGIKPHQCPHCDRAFAQRINLTQHINRNHLEEPRIQQHTCHLCPKRFNHASGLSRHLASHSGVAFQCSECDRTFGDRSSIKRHIANMHSNIKTSKSRDGK